ncbi:MAG: HAD-IA family hydrolase [Nitrospiraceae bacterium]|nr:HAD-IA family hydrolase [Nitrospiraceae bacterium]
MEKKKGKNPPPVPMEDIKYVLLDLDGTLLDKYFDDYFWEHLVPEKYAEKFGVTFGRAKEELLAKYKSHEGTLNWTDLDFWSEELGLDIPALKEQIRHLIEVHPHVEDFLGHIRGLGKKVYLVTNAHYRAIEIKFRKTGIGKYFDHVVASCSMGAPKESPEFWKKTEALLHFEKDKSLFIDDTEDILETAKAYGIKYVLLKEKPASKEIRKKKVTGRFPSIRDFRDLMR